IAVVSAVLVVGADVEDRQVRFAEAADELVTSGDGAVLRLEGRLHGMELDLADLDLAGPRRKAAEEHGDAWMAGELGHLGRRHRSHSVATVVEDEALLAGDAVPPQP